MSWRGIFWLFVCIFISFQNASAELFSFLKRVSIFDTQSELLENIFPDGYTPIRVKLTLPEKNAYTFTSDTPFFIVVEDKKISSLSSQVTIQKYRSFLILDLGLGLHLPIVNSMQILPSVPNQIIEISNIERIPAWDKSKKINDNAFLGGFDIRRSGKDIIVVNELDMEQYLAGVAEVPESDREEKRKALSILIRSYAYYYTTLGQKFPLQHYDASDSPDVFQKYLGHNYSLRSPKWQQTLQETKGLVLTHQGKVLRAPYFSCTLGGKTKLPQEAGWGGKYFLTETKDVWKKVPALDDPKRKTPAQCGHGVGLSGYYAGILAGEGKTYEEILHYFYDSVEIERYGEMEGK